MGNGSTARRFWPSLDVRLPIPSVSLLYDLVLARLDDFQPTAIHEDDASQSLQVFFGSADSRDRACEALHQTFDARQVLIAPVDVPDANWAARSQAGLRAVTVGRFIVTTPSDQAAVPAGSTAIQIIIQPSMGFGTGHHASTRLCLLALQTLDLRGRRVLDVGTGSGLLAIAAVRLGATRAIGFDIDPDALASARENLERNGVVSSIDLELCDFRSISGLRAPVVLANLTGALLTRWAEQLTSLVEEDGYLIASGFTDSEASVLPALETGLLQVGVEREGEWLCAVLHRR